MDGETLGKALGARLTEIEAAMERYRAFVFTSGDTPGPPGSPGQDEPADGGDRTEAARDLVLRALRIAADPTNAALLRRLHDGEATMGNLAELVGLPRLAIWERVNELVAAGLAGHSLETDSAGLTPAGAAVVSFCDEATRAASES
jgi:hypothetical protein